MQQRKHANRDGQEPIDGPTGRGRTSTVGASRTPAPRRRPERAAARRGGRSRWRRAIVCLSLLACPLAAFEAQAAPPGAVDLIAPLDASSAKLQFHEGQVDANGNLAIDPSLPAIAAATSPWILTQWNHSVYARPSDLLPIHGPFGTNDIFLAPDLETGVIVQHLAPNGPPVFTLVNRDGTLTASGGRATYLTTPALAGVANTFDREIDLSYSARISAAAVVTYTPTAAVTGAVLAQAYAGIGLLFVDPAGRDAPQFVFMQAGLTVSNADRIGDGGLICAGATPVLYAPPVPATMLLPFTTDAGELHPIRANLSAAVASMLATPAPCGGNVSPWDDAKRDLANWHMTGIYIGSETENTDLRPGAVTSLPQGHVWLSLDLSDVAITRKVN